MTVAPSTLSRFHSPSSLHLADAERASLATLHAMLAHGEDAGVPASSLLLSALARRRPALVTRGRRTAEWALLLGNEMGVLDAGRQAHDVALLADVGALSLRSSDGAGPWAEWHARQASHDLLAGVPSLASVAPGVLTVAENVDGSGLPLGLVGDEIPLAARIVRLVREFDTASDGWWPGTVGPSVARACAYLVSAAGESLDPAVVHAWLRLLDRHLSEGAA